MNISDFTTLGALIVAALGILVPYFTNRANINARRAEIATENSIEALSKIIANAQTYIKKLYQRSPDLVEAGNEFFDSFFSQYRAYIPRYIFDDLNELWNMLAPLDKIQLKGHGPDEMALLDRADKKLESIIDRIQKHLGLDLKSLPK